VHELTNIGQGSIGGLQGVRRQSQKQGGEETGREGEDSKSHKTGSMLYRRGNWRGDAGAEAGDA